MGNYDLSKELSVDKNVVIIAGILFQNRLKVTPLT